MKLLAIDTSTKNLSLAVSKGEKVLKFRNVKLHRPLSSSIMPAIRKILDVAEIPLMELDGFAVGLGPGSFTGLRVGVSTIKGLAFATNKPVVGVSSLDILAMNVQQDNVVICVLCDAKRNLTYSCLFERKGSVLKRKGGYVLKNIEQVLEGINGKVTFIGDGISLFRNDITKAKGIIPTFINGKHVLPQARCLIPLALEQFQKGKSINVDQLVPLYLYPEHCQVRK